MSEHTWRSHKEVLAEELQDEEFRAIWEAQAPARALAIRLVGYRMDHGMTQTELARRIGIRQPALARMEAGEHMPTINTLDEDFRSARHRDFARHQAINERQILGFGRGRQRPCS